MRVIRAVGWENRRVQRAPVVIMVAGYCPLPDGTATFCRGDTARR